MASITESAKARERIINKMSYTNTKKNRIGGKELEG